MIVQFFMLAALAIQHRDQWSTLHIEGLSVQVMSAHEPLPRRHHYSTPVITTLGVVLLLLAVSSAWGVTRAYGALRSQYQSILAAQQNQAVQAYELQQQATRLNPYLDSLRRRNASLSLSIALALSQKTDLNDQEKQTMAQLIQQAIREAKASTALDGRKTQNWQVLGAVYEQLIGSAEGSDQWAVTSYTQAIQTAPTDPLLRMKLGNLLFNLGKSQEAVALYQQAISLKPENPLGFYNIGKIMENNKRFDVAAQAYQEALKYVPVNSEDYIKLTQELEKAQQQIEATKSATTSKTPTVSPSPAPTAAPLSSASAQLPPITAQNTEISPEESITQPSGDNLNIRPETQNLLNQSDLNTP
jgi:cytochrome c-type biogenesis protein CcmH/NrfG